MKMMQKRGEGDPFHVFYVRLRLYVSFEEKKEFWESALTLFNRYNQCKWGGNEFVHDTAEWVKFTA